MSEKKKFLLRIDGNIYAALEKWAADDLRSINGQIEFLLTDALRKVNRINQNTSTQPSEKENQPNSEQEN
jgi:hypothetical protein